MDADIAIIGAGIIGLAVAAELADGRSNIYLIEKGQTHGRGISSRNSEVIHAGIYYPPESLKGRLCVEGRELLYAICRDHGIPHRRIGKLIIASGRDEMAEVERLRESALRNGVTSVHMVTRDHLADMEPHIRAIGALHSPDTGIVNAHAVMDFFLRTAMEKGAVIVYGTAVQAVEAVAGGYRILTAGSDGEPFSFTSERVINAAGLDADRVAAMIGATYEHHYCKGDYFSIENVKRGTVKRLVYPVPEKDHVGLGVHLTIDLGGRMKLGPDTTYIPREEQYRVEAAKADRFYEAAVRFLPFIRREDIVPDMSGIRPKLQGPGEGFRDFVISEDRPGFVNLVGIESPGLTAAPAIARYVKRLLQGAVQERGPATTAVSREA